MSGVTDGQAVSADVSNGAFLARNGDSDTVGKIDLLEGNSDSIVDVQKVINQGLPKNSTQVVTTVISITEVKDTNIIRVDAGSVVTLDSTPFGPSDVNFVDGMTVLIIGLNDTNTVTIEHSDEDYGCILNGNITLERFVTITLAYDSTLKRFIEVARNV